MQTREHHDGRFPNFAPGKPLTRISWQVLEEHDNTDQEHSQPCGVPGTKARIPAKDVYLLVVEAICVVVGLTTIFYSQLAISLGQVNQLIVIGFVIAIMSMCLEGQALRTALMHTARRKHSTIQDIDALMRKDAFASQVHFAYRLLLFCLLGLPLLLSVAYKTFTGGESTRVTHHGNGFFGFSSTPGKQRIGDGLSQLPDIYVPFWIDPGLNRTYGFNMYIPSDNRTGVIVDSPYPTYLTNLQSSLSKGQTITLSATVNATVSEMVNPTDAERKNDDYWSVMMDEFGRLPSQNGGVGNAYNAIWAGSGNMNGNFSVMFFSAWNESSNETFTSEAIRVEQTRRMAHATWLVSDSNISLVETTLLENSILRNQSLIQINFLGLQELFSTFLGEYDWHNRAQAFDFPYPSPTGDNDTSRYFQPVNTVPALAVAMTWARMTSLDTIDRPLGIQSPLLRSLTGYPKASGDILTITTFPTLKRHWLLVMVLLTNPLLSITCVLAKAFVLYTSPIGDGFSTVSLLAAAEASDLSSLRGASLTGRLDRGLRMDFNVVQGASYQQGQRVVLALDQYAHGQGSRHVQKYIVYS
jgi:hypothetical protein